MFTLWVKSSIINTQREKLTEVISEPFRIFHGLVVAAHDLIKRITPDTPAIFCAPLKCLKGTLECICSVFAVIMANHILAFRCKALKTKISLRASWFLMFWFCFLS